MAGRRMRGRSVGKLLNRGLLFKRIRDLEGIIDICNVESVVSHLRQSYREYACKKLIPFTACVQHALEDYRTRRVAHQKEDDTEKATPSARRPKRARTCSEASSSSSFVISSDEVAMDMESKSEINLITASIREAYSKPRLQQMPNCSNEKEGIQQENARANDNANLITTSGPWFRDFGGIKKIIAYLIRKVVFPFLHPERGASIGIRPCSGILLHGPPGCGKTMLANAIANEMGLPFYSISSTEIVSGITGASEEKLRELFEKAHRSAPSVIFIDEVDAISSKRDSTNSRMEVRIVSELINCMNRSQKQSGKVLVIGATNRPDAVDPSLRRPGRFDREILLDAPDEQARREILSRLTEELDIDETVDLSKVARAASGYTGTDLVELVSEAGQCALERVTPRGEMEISDELMKNQERMWWRQLWFPAETENLSISMIDFEDAAKLVQPSLKREGFSSIPSVKWEDVGGLDFLRKEFDRHIIRRVKDPEKFKKLSLGLETGFLLYGPPGCGKTLIVKAVANEAGANFIYVKGPELLNKYVGESERAMRTLFDRAEKCSPCIIFIDEIDAVTCSGRDSDSVVERLASALILELDGAEKRRGVIVIGATNKLKSVAPAIRRPGRLGKVVYVPLPNSEGRVLILKTLTKKYTLAVDVDLALIAEDCENFSGADLSSLVEEAVLEAGEEESSDDPGVSSLIVKSSHFQKARKKVTPSVSPKRRRYYERLSKQL